LKFLASLLIAVGCLLAVPVAASAVVYTVDSTADEPDALPGTGGCLTAGPKCTLRAAIEESNFSTGLRDEIKFSAAFDGQLADTINLASSLPAIKDPVSVLGGDCFGEDGPDKPCAGVKGPAGASALTVENANGVVIEGLSVTEALTAINVLDSSTEFVARNDWIGAKLDGSAGGNTVGIFLDPDSDLAVIGGIEASERNVFASNAGDGLDVLGADNVEVLGNYFGVAPDGTTTASNGKDIEVNSTAVGGFTATGNVIGHSVSPAAAATPGCDGGCNVISGATVTGVDLQGDGGQEAPAVATIVEGNFVGLDAAGTAVRANGTYDVNVGHAGGSLVGGLAAGTTNFIAGGAYGVYSEAEDLRVLGNVIGRAPGGGVVTAPATVGVFVFCLGLTEPATVAGNLIRMSGGIGIEHRFLGAQISENAIEGGEYGIKTFASNAPNGSEIEANEIEGATANGILIENENNLIVGNEIEGSGQAGIRIEENGGVIPAPGNLIGGDSAAEENLIAASGGDAIEIVGDENTDEQIARNRGGENGGLFIDLGGNGAGNGVSGPNAGIQPPSIDSAKLTGASGSGALPGATVRVFRKATTSPGEIASFLGEATADGGGKWTVAYAGKIPGETQIAATQSGLEGTSELALAKTEPEPKTGGGGSGGSGDDKGKGGKGKGGKNKGGKGKGKGGSGGGALETTILKGPKGKIHSTKAKFKFVANEKGAKFECKLDRRKFKPCKSPKVYRGLKPGKHVFKVRAVKGKRVDPTPAKRKFKVVK
jgi:CSLREA domain-containing protein